MIKLKSYLKLFLLLVSIVSIEFTANSQQLKNVTLQLKWKHQFQLLSDELPAPFAIEAGEDEGDAVRFRLRAPRELARFIAPKGSVALDGTSLTVNKVSGTDFDVLIIHHTLGVTTWGERRAGDLVNLEIDTMARYAARLVEAAKEGL